MEIKEPLPDLPEDKKPVTKEKLQEIISRINSKEEDKQKINDQLIKEGLLTFGAIAGDISGIDLSREKIPEDIEARLKDPATRLGNYALIEDLGRGGNGVVYKAFDPSLKRFVAIKLFNIRDESSIKTFRKESEIAARLEHPNIAPIYEVGSYEGKHFIVMKYIQGETLDLLAAGSNKNRNELIHIILKICEAITYAHSKGVIHRDIKPQNILIDNLKNVYVVDFGIARNIDTILTATKDIVGTPQYMAPEQAEGARTDARTDVYSVGATLYFCMTGQDPFEGKTTMEIIKKAAEIDPVDPKKIDLSLPNEIQIVIKKAMAKEPSRRYQSVDAFKDDLDRFLKGEPILAKAPSVFYIITRKLRKYKRQLTALSIALLILGSLIFTYFYNAYKKQSEIDANYYLGRLSMERNEGAKAIEYYKKVLELDPNHTKTLNNLGGIYLNSGLTDAAIELFKKAITLNPAVPEPYINLGAAYRFKQNYDDAIGMFNKALELDKTGKSVHLIYLDMGLTYIELKNYNEAAKCFQKSIESNKNYFEAYLNLGVVLTYLGDERGAEKNFKKAIKLKPDYILAHANLAGLYQNRGDLDKAMEIFKTVITIKPDDSITYRNMGTICIARGLLKEAEGYFKKAVKYDPNDYEAYYQMGKVCTELGKREEAREHFFQCLQIKPDDPPALTNISAVCIDLQMFKEGLDYGLKALETSRNEPMIYNNIGVAYFNLSHSNEAIEYLKKGLEINNNEPKLHFNLGLVYVEIGNKKLAVKHLDEMKRLNYEYVDFLSQKITEKFGE
ncbi:MAG: tetratricopeptide repeat protein [Planctomycetes bacterium]|nr:tetratricopeptide repeat protein [Planctomycetota bacterium]